jgi:hypothetical protein
MASKKKRTRRRKTTVERKHEVKVKIENFTLAKAKSALTLQIYSREEKLGELQVGRGSLYWWGANRQKEKRVPWDLFAAMMNKLAYGDE